MVRVELQEVFVEDVWKEPLAIFRGDTYRWYANVALKLLDQSRNSMLAEWFYLVVCSSAYIQKPDKNGPILDDKYTIVAERIDIEVLQKIARSKVQSIHAQTWDEWFLGMSKEFLWEDDKRHGGERDPRSLGPDIIA